MVKLFNFFFYIFIFSLIISKTKALEENQISKNIIKFDVVEKGVTPGCEM